MSDTKLASRRTITGVASVTLVAFYHACAQPIYPAREGNCFSAYASNGKEYKIVNFFHENLEEVQKRGVTFPMQVYELGERVAVLHDPRIPDEWYESRYCETCCPVSLLPLPQVLAHDRAIQQGVRMEGAGYVTINNTKRPVLRKAANQL